MRTKFKFYTQVQFICAFKPAQKEKKFALRQRLWNGRKKRGQRERKMFYNAQCDNKGL